jgi:hypothetical protein
VRAVARRGLHDGRVDRDILVAELARNTSLTRDDAQDIANRFGDRYEELATKLEGAKERAVEVGLEAADRTGKTLLLGGLMMLVSMLAAIGGGALGVRKRDRVYDREFDERVTARTVVVPPPPPPPAAPPSPPYDPVV